MWTVCWKTWLGEGRVLDCRGGCVGVTEVFIVQNRALLSEKTIKAAHKQVWAGAGTHRSEICPSYWANGPACRNAKI